MVRIIDTYCEVYRKLNRDPYQAYVDNGVVGSNPVQLVIAMYETAITRTQEAAACVERGDVWGRARAISHANKILTQLIVTLNPEVSGNVGKNLDRLYHYMQRKLQQAHLEKRIAPLSEVEKLLRTLLEGWYKVAEAERRAEVADRPTVEPSVQEIFPAYGAYAPGMADVERLAVSA